MSLISVATTIFAKEKIVKINIVQTSDIHGNCFPYNFIAGEEWKGSLSRVSTFVNQQRKTYGKNLILLENGDILQGQPSAYYYNFINTKQKHLFADALNFMKYDAGNIGNHDIETGHEVYDRWIKQCKFPIISANTINAATDQPYLTPYKIFKRNDVKIAVIGLITPAIPAWLPENLWEGLYFKDMVETAKEWIPIIKQNEKPDLIIGLFHAGQDINHSVAGYAENASLEVAKKVDGFDIILIGHDHRKDYKFITNDAGHKVLIANPANNGNWVANIEVEFTLKNKKVTSKTISGGLEDINKYQPDAKFLKKFNSQFLEIKEFVSEKIGYCTETISTRPAYFGSSAFIDFIHDIQLNIADADISFAAPLSFDAQIDEGNIHISDMFTLMKYENMLYAMQLSGKEIKDYLEYSYYIWTSQMSSPDDHMLWFKETKTEGDESRASFQHESYNFDSAAGIIYTVDLTKPRGEKVNIISMADGSPFELNKNYKVAINSYRGNGGGGLLTSGAGIPKDELTKRIMYSTDKDLRFYMLEYIRKNNTISPKAHNNWKFIPEEYVEKASKRDFEKLFPAK